MPFGADFFVVKCDVEFEIDRGRFLNGDDGSKRFHVGSTDE